MFVLTKSKGGGTGALPPGLAITVINGQPMLTLEDTTRLNKILSVGEQGLMFAENQLSNNDWIRIGTANDALSGYIADFDGTIVYAEGHCENAGAASKAMRIYINDVDSTVDAGVLGPGANVNFNNTLLNLDFNQGDKIQLRAVEDTVPLTGLIQDTVVKLTIKWRG